jgi:hypothetical protein
MIARCLFAPIGFVLAVALLGGCGGAPEPTGTLEVSTATAGDTLDPDGYTVTMAEIDTASGKAGVRDTQAVRPSGTVTFEELPEADYEIALSGVQVNCLPKDSSSQRVSVPAEDTTEASFTLTCAPALLDRIVALLLLALPACQQMEQVGVSPVAFGVNVRPTGAR